MIKYSRGGARGVWGRNTSIRLHRSTGGTRLTFDDAISKRGPSPHLQASISKKKTPEEVVQSWTTDLRIARTPPTRHRLPGRGRALRSRCAAAPHLGDPASARSDAKSSRYSRRFVVLFRFGNHGCQVCRLMASSAMLPGCVRTFISYSCVWIRFTSACPVSAPLLGRSAHALPGASDSRPAWSQEKDSPPHRRLLFVRV